MSYFRIGLEILGGVNEDDLDQIETAIGSLRMHLMAKRRSPIEIGKDAVTYEDREIEAGQIAGAEGWSFRLKDVDADDEEGERYQRYLEVEAEIDAQRALAATDRWGVAPGEKCPNDLLPDGAVCPRCGERRGPSGIDGGSWVHY